MILKPPRWNVSPWLIAPEARGLWKGVAFVAPLWGGAGKGALLGPHGGPLAGADLAAGSALQWRGTPFGLGVGITGNTDLLKQSNFAPLVTSDGVGGGDFTVICLANPVAEAVMSAGVNVEDSAAGTTRMHLGFNCDASNGAVSSQFAFVTRQSSSSTSALVAGGIDGKYHLFGGVRQGTKHYAYIDGIIRATVTGTVRDFIANVPGLGFGCRAETVGFRINTATNIVLEAGWNRALSDAEMRLLARDPFIMFRMAQVSPSLWAAAGPPPPPPPAGLYAGLALNPARLLSRG